VRPRGSSRWAWAPLVAVLATGCWPVGAETVELSGDQVVIDGVANDPVGESVVAASIDTPVGAFTVTTFDSALGPCYDVRFPDGHTEANCLRGSGIEPDAPISGRPGGSIEGLNGGYSNLGLAKDRSPVGVLHHGFAHPDVTTVTIEPAEADGGVAFGGFPLVTAPNVEGMVVFLAWAPPGLERYTLTGYGADGCRLDADAVALDGGALDVPGAGRDCSVRLPTQLRSPETDAG
jgi:hypothetical protein